MCHLMLKKFANLQKLQDSLSHILEAKSCFGRQSLMYGTAQLRMPKLLRSSFGR